MTNLPHPSQLMTVNKTMVETESNENNDEGGPQKKRKRYSDTINKFEILEKKKVKCLVCGKTYFNKDTFNRHYNDIHRENKIPKYNKPLEWLKCNKCQKSYANKQTFKAHKCVPIDGVFCGQCNEKYSNKTNLKNHIQAVHEGKGFKCQVCDKKFATRGTRKFHIEMVHK